MTRTSRLVPDTLRMATTSESVTLARAGSVIMDITVSAGLRQKTGSAGGSAAASKPSGPGRSWRITTPPPKGPHSCSAASGRVWSA